MNLSNKKIALILFALALISLTSLGFFFRATFTYWFFTGTSIGKTFLFFLFAGIVYLTPWEKINSNKIWIFNSLHVFIASIFILYFLSTFGFFLTLNEYSIEKIFTNSNNTWILSYYEESFISINWLGLIHNHYLKPIISPITFFLKDFAFDSALPLASLVKKEILIVAFPFLILAIIALIKSLKTKKEDKLFFLYILNGFGLLTSTLDGGLISAITQINVTIFLILLLNDFLSNNKNFPVLIKEPIIRAITFLLASIISLQIFKWLSITFLGEPPIFHEFVLIPTTFISILIASLEESKFKYSKYFLFILSLIIILIAFYNYSELFNSNQLIDSIEKTEITEAYFKVLNNFQENELSASLEKLGKHSKLGEKTYFIEFNSKKTIKEFFKEMKNNGFKIIIFTNSKWNSTTLE